MATASAQTSANEGLAQRRSRARVSPYDGAMVQSTPRDTEKYSVRWQGLNDDMFSDSKQLAEESCIKPVSDNEDNNDSDKGIESDDPTNTAMFLVESEEKELNEIVPGTPQAFSKLGQLTVQSINRQRVSQTPGKTPLQRSATKDENSNGRSSNKSKSHSSSYGSPSKRGKVLQTDSLGAPVPVFQLPSPPKESIVKTEGLSTPKCVRIINSSRRAEMILDKIKASERIVEIPAAKRESPVGERRRTPIKPTFERNEFAPIGFPSLVSKGNISDKMSEHQHTEQPKNIGRRPSLDKGKAVASSSAAAAAAATGAMSSATMASALPVPKHLETTESQKEQKNLLDSAAGTAQNIDNYLLQTPPKKGAAARNSSGNPETPITVEQIRRLDQLRNFIKTSERQPQEFAILGTPAQAARRKSEADQTRLDSYKSRSDNKPNRVFDIQDRQVPRFNLPEQQDMTAINLIDSMSFSQISSIHEESIGPEEGNNESQQHLLLSYTSHRHDEDSSKAHGARLRQRQLAHRDTAVKDADHGTGFLATCGPNIMDMSLQLTRSIAALDGGLWTQLQRQPGAETGAGAGAGDNAEAAHLGAVADAVERANTELVQSPADEDGQASPIRNSELESQVKTLRETMSETKEIVFSIRQELDQQKHGQRSDDTKLDDIVRLLGALDMRLHMLEGRQQQQQQSLKAQPKAASSGSIKVAAEMPAQQVQQQDIVSLIGHLFVNCLTRYPLTIIGSLVIILVLELLTISGLGSRAVYELKQFLPAPPPPLS
ncbi:hypothetical protein H4R99_000538 [Coemansia sp. RSA 1722]|nr:hypothetical protein H4R99_000538 [Coemansia sp. RSA 1722]